MGPQLWANGSHFTYTVARSPLPNTSTRFGHLARKGAIFDFWLGLMEEHYCFDVNI